MKLLRILLIESFLFLVLFGLADAQEYTSEINVEKDAELYIYSDAGKVDIFIWNKDKVRLYCSGGRVRTAKYEKNIDAKIYAQSNNNPKTEIYLPENININFTSAGGDIEFHDKHSATVKISTTSGNISIETLNGDAELSTGGGDIKIENINGNLKIYETVGNIRIKKISGSADIKTLGGDINIQSIEKSLDANTKAGSIEIGDIGGNANVTNQSGNVKIGNVKKDATLNSGGGDIFLKSGNGYIKARSTGGDITLKNIYGSVQARTDGGKIVVELRPGIYDKFQSSTIETEKGDILFYIPEKAYAKISASIYVTEKQDGTKRVLNSYDIKSDFRWNKNDYKILPFETTRRGYQEFYLPNINKESPNSMTIYLHTNNSNIEIRKLKK